MFEPLTEICNKRYSDPRQRQLFKNIIYVGVLAEIDVGLGPGVREDAGGSWAKAAEAL